MKYKTRRLLGPEFGPMIGESDVLRLVEESLEQILAGVDGNGISVSLPKEKALNKEEKSVLLTAMFLGYYDSPRAISLRDLSRDLGIKPLTLSFVLWDAQLKIAANFIR